MSVRIHQIAKEIGMENKELLTLLQDRGFAVKSVSSTIDNISADSLIEELGKTEPPEEGASEKAEPREDPAKEEFKRPKGPIVRTREEVEAEKEAEKAAKSPVAQAKSGPTKTEPTGAVPSTPAPSTPPKAPAPPPTAAKAPPSPRPPAAPKPPGAPRPPVPPARPGAPKPPAPPSASVPSASDEAAPPEDTSAQPAGSKTIQAKPPIIVRDFASQLGLKPFQLLSDLMDRGIFASMNQTIEEEVAAKVAQAHGYVLEIKHRGEGEGGGESKKKKKEVDESALLEPRPPVVCILGHVDHGKTTLLDAIRKAKIVDDEFGGITQHIGAYQVESEGEKITFLDTPGHSAFSRMRERGASLTDISILVIAADDGFKPQTDEALKFSKKAQTALVVAINKIDTKGANPDKVKAQMQERGIPPEDLGGDVITVPISALKGEGIDQLLEMVRLQSEVMELKAVAKGKASGVIIESQIEQGRGPTATVLVQKGTLKAGDALVSGICSCKVKAMHDDRGQIVKVAGPSTPVKVLGWSEAPESGGTFEAVKNEREAKRIAEESLEERQKKQEQERLEAKSGGSNLDDLFSAIESTRKTAFKVIVKADVHGSLEAIQGMLEELPSDKVELQVVGKGVGMVTKKDVELAGASEATIIGFNVRLENGVQGHAKHLGVQILQDNIIYQLIDLVRDSMSDLLEPELQEKKLGVAEVRAVFPLGKGFVAGCMVTEGKIQRNATIRLMRNGTLVHEGKLATLKRFKDDATEVRAGFECGVGIGSHNDYKEGDLIECFAVEKIRPTL